MASNFTVKVVTPEKIVAEYQAVALTLPTQAGEITVLPGHVPLITALQAGELTVKQAAGPEIHLAVSRGLAEISPSLAMVLADTAERAEEIDEKKAAAAHQQALELMAKAEKSSDQTNALMVAKIEKELARLKVVRKHHTRTHPTTES